MAIVPESAGAVGTAAFDPADEPLSAAAVGTGLAGSGNLRANSVLIFFTGAVNEAICCCADAVFIFGSPPLASTQAVSPQPSIAPNVTMDDFPFGPVIMPSIVSIDDAEAGRAKHVANKAPAKSCFMSNSRIIVTALLTQMF